MDVRDRNRRDPDESGERVPLTTAVLAVLGVVGIWLMLTPWILADPEVQPAARWADPVIGALVVVVAVGRLAFPGPLRWTGPFHASLGAALLVTPSLLPSGEQGSPEALLASDLVCGVVIVGLALLTLPSVEAGAAARSGPRSRTRR